MQGLIFGSLFTQLNNTWYLVQGHLVWNTTYCVPLVRKRNMKTMNQDCSPQLKTKARIPPALPVLRSLRRTATFVRTSSPHYVLHGGMKYFAVVVASGTIHIAAIAKQNLSDYLTSRAVRPPLHGQYRRARSINLYLIWSDDLPP